MGLVFSLGLSTAGSRVQAEPVAYVLDPSASRINFFYSLGGAQMQGEMPIASAQVLIDPQALASSRVDVVLGVAEAKAGLILATEAMKSQSVLDTARFPTARFVSTRVRLSASGRISDGAEIDGILELRGVKRSVTLRAALYRPPGTAVDDLRQLSFRLNGALSRAEFGAAGYPGLVDDTVEIRIRAEVTRKQ